jgi:hypothetical protein
MDSPPITTADTDPISVYTDYHLGLCFYDPGPSRIACVCPNASASSISHNA